VLGRFGLRSRRLCQATVAMCLLISGCTREARLYPSVDSPSNVGVLKATYVDYGLGMGSIRAEMPDGEKLEGEYSTQDNAIYGFGSIISQAGSATLSAASFGGSQRGVASLIGDRGTRMQCEYFTNVMTGSGAGACKTSKGAIFQLHF